MITDITFLRNILPTHIYTVMFTYFIMVPHYIVIGVSFFSQDVSTDQTAETWHNV